MPVASVRTTATPRTFYFNPTYTLDRNLLGAQGELLFAAGTKANPLDIVSLSRHLLFLRRTRQPPSPPRTRADDALPGQGEADPDRAPTRIP